jgi:hypothetical protein
MAGMQAHATLPVDQFGHAGQRPEIVEETMGLGTLQQSFPELLPVARAELGTSPQGASLPRRTTARLALAFPAQRRGATDAAASGHFRLENPLAQKPHPFTSPLFHSVEVPLGLGYHAGRVCYSFMRESIVALIGDGVSQGYLTVPYGGIYTLQTTPAPQLNLAPSGSNLNVSWIIPSTNFVLQQTADLVSWADLTNAPTLNFTNLQNEIILSPTGSSGFYRLKTP